jgi:hypothetical protein
VKIIIILLPSISAVRVIPVHQKMIQSVISIEAMTVLIKERGLTLRGRRASAD